MIDRVVPWTLLLAANRTAAIGASNHVATATQPTTTSNPGLLNTQIVEGTIGSILQLMFFGAGAGGNTVEARIWGWSTVNNLQPGPVGYGSTAVNSVLWVPTLLADLTATLSTLTGVANFKPNATDLLADTLTLASGFNLNTSVEITSPNGDSANLSPALAQIDVKGFGFIEVELGKGNATNANGLYRLLD